MSSHDDLDDRVRQQSAVALVGGGDPDDDRALRSVGRQLAVRDDRREDVLRVALEDVLGRHVPVVAPDQGTLVRVGPPAACARRSALARSRPSRVSVMFADIVVVARPCRLLGAAVPGRAHVVGGASTTLAPHHPPGGRQALQVRAQLPQHREVVQPQPAPQVRRRRWSRRCPTSCRSGAPPSARAANATSRRSRRGRAAARPAPRPRRRSTGRRSPSATTPAPRRRCRPGAPPGVRRGGTRPTASARPAGAPTGRSPRSVSPRNRSR